MQRQWEAATGHYQQALHHKPDLVIAHNALGLVLQSQGLLPASYEHFQQALSLNPNFAEAYNNLGITLEKLGQLPAAIALFQQALTLRPDLVEAHTNLGNTLELQGRYAEAAECHRQAIAQRPNFAAAYMNLGLVLHKLSQLSEAAAVHQQAIALNPHLAGAYSNLGLTLHAQGLVAEAIQCYQRTLEIDPEFEVARSNLLHCLLFSPDHSPTEQVTEAHHWATRHGLVPASPPPSSLPDPNRPLRVGYVSPDFCTHSVSYFIEPILAHHNPQIVETVCYAQVYRPDAVTQRLQQAAGKWHFTLGWNDTQLIEQIQADGIDILVDLAGHTANNRLRVFAHQPAPLQISYLGYPATTGLTQMDYRLTDAWADPVGQTEDLYTEKLVRLPHCFLCYQPFASAPEVAPLPALSAGRITFGSFNHLAKMQPKVIALWAEILTALPTAQIMLKNGSLDDPATRDRCRQLFEAQGIDAQRVQLVGFLPASQDHLGLYNQIDIGLDTFPYNGTTTTCEALWMGVPVITLAGTVHVERVGMSLLSAVELTDLVTTSPTAYLAKAVELAQNLEKLAQWRTTLRQRLVNSTLCDPPRFVHSLEQTYRQLWQSWCQEQSPRQPQDS